MKIKSFRFLILLSCVFLLSSSCAILNTPIKDLFLLENTSNEKQEPTIQYKIGDKGPAGGIIAYKNNDSSMDWTYIEVAPSNWNNEEIDPKFFWGARKKKVGELAREIGSGYDNTKRIVDFISQYEVASYAALVCDQLNFGGYNDWFLPCDEELYLLYTNLHLNGLGNFSIDDSYYSSSEVNSLNSHILSMKNGNIASSSKNSPKYIRPIRRF